VPRELRGKEVGCSQFVTYVFMALGGLAGGFLYENVSPIFPFFVAFKLVMVCLILQVLFVKEPQKRHL